MLAHPPFYIVKIRLEITKSLKSNVSLKLYFFRIQNYTLETEYYKMLARICRYIHAMCICKDSTKNTKYKNLVKNSCLMCAVN